MSEADLPHWLDDSCLGSYTRKYFAKAHPDVQLVVEDEDRAVVPDQE